MTAQVKLNPLFVEQDGERKYAMIPYEEYVALREYLEDLEDSAEMEAAVIEEGNAPTITLDEFKTKYGLV